jgi:hypothetical protein
MNPQPHPFVGQLGVLIFVLLIAYFAFTNKKKSYAFDDKFTIGYIYDDHPVVAQSFESNTKPMRTVKKKRNNIPANLITPILETKKTFDEDLVNDCVSALVSLGTKKTLAKKMAKDIFETHNPQTIEEFIKFIYIK